MKYFLTLFFIALLNLNSQLESSIPVDSVDYEVYEDQVEEDIEENSHPWSLFIFDNQINSLNIRFPVPPVTVENESSISHFSVDTDTFPLVYRSLTYSVESIAVNPSELFEAYLSHFPKETFTVLHADTKLVDDEYHLDFFIIDSEHRIVREEQIVVTANNVYYLCTLYFLNTLGNHDAFVSSFEIA